MPGRRACRERNELLTLFEQACGPWETQRQQPWFMRHEPDAFLSAYEARVQGARTYSWAVPTPEALETIKRVSPTGVLEIGAGTGYWAMLLRQLGVDVIAYDAEPPDEHDLNDWHQGARCWTEVVQGGPDHAAEHPERTLMLCWPPLVRDDDNSCLALDALSVYGGETVVYIGENGGATAGDAFHQALEDGWHEAEVVAIPQWPGMHDYLMVWRRGTASAKGGNDGHHPA
jgi:hypothetical protein